MSFGATNNTLPGANRVSGANLLPFITVMAGTRTFHNKSRRATRTTPELYLVSYMIMHPGADIVIDSEIPLQYCTVSLGPDSESDPHSH